MNTCPCCSHQLLRHIRNHQNVWFCRHCWQEMPLTTPALNQLLNQLGPLNHAPIYAGRVQTL